MFVIEHSYLSQLEHPEEAITEDVWRAWRATLLDKSVSSEHYRELLELDAKYVATNCGVLWKTESSDTISDLLQKDFFDIKHRKHVGEWIKKSITLTMSKLVGMTDEEIEKVVTLPPTEKELAEMALKEEYNDARIQVNKFVDTARKEMNNENYESTFRGLLEICLRTFAVLGDLSEERAKKYIPIAFDRFFNNLKIKEISEKYEIQHGVVNNIFNKIGETFSQKIMATQEQLELFDRKFMALYEVAYVGLDTTDKAAWANRLQLMKNFRKYFVGKELDA